ncbi:MAG TPA: hypothetical protein PKB10_03305, partial [Tepidisphaeraceae bacterium]|nr:hypothetical protein [Tepidisphaeraceae bacterium]
MRTPSQAVAGKLSRATTAVIFTGFVFAGSESLAVEREHPTLTLRTPLELDIRPHREMRTDQTSPLAARPEALLTWNAPNSGLFSDPANWSAGVPGAGDDLNFGGTGAASYVAQNDQVLV